PAPRSGGAPFEEMKTARTGLCPGTVPAPRAIACAISSGSVTSGGRARAQTAEVLDQALAVVGTDGTDEDRAAVAEDLLRRVLTRIGNHMQSSAMRREKAWAPIRGPTPESLVRSGRAALHHAAHASRRHGRPGRLLLRLLGH